MFHQRYVELCTCESFETGICKTCSGLVIFHVSPICCARCLFTLWCGGIDISVSRITCVRLRYANRTYSLQTENQSTISVTEITLKHQSINLAIVYDEFASNPRQVKLKKDDQHIQFCQYHHDLN